MTPPAAVASPTRVVVWVLDGIGHRLHGGMSVGCWEPITVAGRYLDINETDRHEVRPCYDRRCFPNGFRQYRAVA